MAEPGIQRFLDLVVRELGAADARIEIGGKDPKPGRYLWYALGNGWRVVAQFDFHGAAEVSFWLILSRDDVTLCLTDPGYDVNLLVTADLATLFRVWGGRIQYREALARQGITVAGVPAIARAFPRWFGWDVKPKSVEVHAMSAS